jgi:fumarylpyruvate hydrolase
MDYHFEMELVLALNAPAFQADPETAAAAIWAYGAGLDMTRRDLQISERSKQRPWDLGKDVEGSCILAALTTARDFGPVADQRIRLTQNDTLRQDATLGELVWKPVEIVQHLSRFYHIGPGDLIMTGTPAGVGPVQPGDVLAGRIDGLAPVALTSGPPAGPAVQGRGRVAIRPYHIKAV